MDVLIQGLLGGLLFALVGLGIRAIKKAINRKKNKMISELSFDSINMDLSNYEKLAVFHLLWRIAKCDSEINYKESSVLQIVFLILGLDRMNQKEMNNIETELEKLSNDELLEYLANFEWEHKEWFVKTIIYVVENDEPITQQETDFIKPILSSIGITKEQLIEIKNRICK